MSKTDLTHYWVWEESSGQTRTFRCLICKRVHAEKTDVDPGSTLPRRRCVTLAGIVLSRKRNGSTLGADIVQGELMAYSGPSTISEEGDVAMQYTYCPDCQEDIDIPAGAETARCIHGCRRTYRVIRRGFNVELSPYHQKPWGDLMSVDEFREEAKCGNLIDYDGCGSPFKDGFVDPSMEISPERLADIPDDATHIDWYNR